MLTKETIADIRNKLQAPLTVLGELSKGDFPPAEAVTLAIKDLQTAIETLNNE